MFKSIVFKSDNWKTSEWQSFWLHIIMLIKVFFISIYYTFKSVPWSQNFSVKCRDQALISFLSGQSFGLGWFLFDLSWGSHV